MFASDDDDEEANDDTLGKIIKKLKSSYPSYFELEENVKKLKRTKWDSILRRLETERNVGYDTDLEMVRSHNFRAFILMKQGKTDDAREANEEALRLQENNVCALVSKGMLFCSEQSTLEAEEVLQQLSRLEEISETFAVLKAEAEGELGYAYSRMSPKFYGESINKFEVALQQCPNKYIWKFGLALMIRRCLHMSNAYLYPVELETTKMQVRQAAEYLVDITRYASDTDGSLRGKACVEVAELLNHVENYPFLEDFKPEVHAVMKEKLGKVWTMEELLKRARELAPKSEFVLERCGKYLRYLKQFDQARDNLEKALTIRPTSFAHHHLGLLFRTQAYRNATRQLREQSKRGNDRRGGRSRGRGRGRGSGDHRGKGREHREESFTDGPSFRGQWNPQAMQTPWGYGPPQSAIGFSDGGQGRMNRNQRQGGPWRGSRGRPFNNANNNSYQSPFFRPDPMVTESQLEPETRTPLGSCGRKDDHNLSSNRATEYVADFYGWERGRERGGQGRADPQERGRGLQGNNNIDDDDDKKDYQRQFHVYREDTTVSCPAKRTSLDSCRRGRDQNLSSRTAGNFPLHQNPIQGTGAIGGSCDSELADDLGNLSLDSGHALFGSGSQGSQTYDSGLGTMSPSLLSQDGSAMYASGVLNDSSMKSSATCEDQPPGDCPGPAQRSLLSGSVGGGQRSTFASPAADPDETCLMKAWTPPQPGQQLRPCGLQGGKGTSSPEWRGSATPAKVPQSWMYKKMMKSPNNDVQLSLEDEHVQKAIKHFNEAWGISETNIRALYDLGLIYKATGDYEGALKYFKKVLDTNLNYVAPMDQANASEQIGLCYLAMSRDEDAPLKRDRLKELATEKFQRAIEVQCQAAKNIPGMSVEGTWNSFSTLKALIEGEKGSDSPASKLKELARLHELIGSHHKAISLYEELRKLDESEWNNAETMKKMVGTYSTAGCHPESIHLFNLLCSFSPANRRKALGKVAVDVYLLAAEDFHRKRHTDKMKECFQSVFCFFNPPADDQDVEEDLWDVMIMHEDTDVLAENGERLETVMQSMCGLRVTRNGKDLLLGQSELDVVGVMERCKSLIILLDHTPLSQRMNFLLDIAFNILQDNPKSDNPLTSINVVILGETTQVPTKLTPCPGVACPSFVPSEGSPECLAKVVELMRTIVTKQKIKSNNTSVKTVA